MPFMAAQLPLKRWLLHRKPYPDVVIVEYHLPDANGHSLIEKLNLLAPEAAIIVLSEYDFQDSGRVLHRCENRDVLEETL